MKFFLQFVTALHVSVYSAIITRFNVGGSAHLRGPRPAEMTLCVGKEVELHGDRKSMEPKAIAIIFGLFSCRLTATVV
jgi:hypothetical protein